MGAQGYDSHRISPWSSWAEWHELYELTFQNPPDIRRLASILSAYRIRRSSTLPIALESTIILIDYVHRAVNPTRDPGNDYSLRLGFSLAIIRLVNGLTDQKQSRATGAYARSVLSISEEVGLPRDLVDVRHESVHGKLPTLEVLIAAGQRAIGWLRQEYWERQSESVRKTAEYEVKLLNDCTVMLLRIEEENTKNKEGSGVIVDEVWKEWDTRQWELKLVIPALVKVLGERFAAEKEKDVAKGQGLLTLMVKRYDAIAFTGAVILGLAEEIRNFEILLAMLRRYQVGLKVSKKLVKLLLQRGPAAFEAYKLALSQCHLPGKQTDKMLSLFATLYPSVADEGMVISENPMTKGAPGCEDPDEGWRQVENPEEWYECPLGLAPWQLSVPHLLPGLNNRVDDPPLRQNGEDEINIEGKRYKRVREEYEGATDDDSDDIDSSVGRTEDVEMENARFETEENVGRRSKEFTSIDLEVIKAKAANFLCSDLSH